MNVFWKLFDPLLLKMRSRLEHLDSITPSERHRRVLEAASTLDATAHTYATTGIDNPYGAAQVRIGAYADVHGLVQLQTTGATIEVGRYSYVGPESRIVASGTIAIGEYVLISHLVDIIDGESHSLDWRVRREEAEARRTAASKTSPGTTTLVIEDDVWIGAKATILGGVRIGRGAVIAANSVVLDDVPPFTLVAGSPATFRKELRS